MDKEYYLAKWLNNEINEQELGEFLSKKDIAEFNKIRKYSGQIESPGFDTVQTLEEIKHKRLNSDSKIRRLNPRPLLIGIAASLVVLFASYYFISTQHTSLNTQYAEKATYNLPDGSEFVLNAGSEVSYVKNNWEDDRKLSLDGEAFFKVKKGKTFSVETTFGTVKVLGTQFNIISRSNFFEVMCYKGLVSITFNNITRELPAGNAFRALKNKEIDLNTFDAIQPSWILNYSTFKSIPYYQVLKEFERQYNVTIDIKNINLDSLFTGSFEHTNQEQALKAISIPLNLSYKVEGNKVILFKDEAQ